jgi:hypothetical protein
VAGINRNQWPEWPGIRTLDRYPYCGHSVLMGKSKREWQEADYILKFYNGKYSMARRRYRQLELKPEDVLASGKYPQSVRARSLLCFWATRELGMTTVDLAKKLNLAQPTVSQAARRGQKIVRDWGLRLIEKDNQ